MGAEKIDHAAVAVRTLDGIEGKSLPTDVIAAHTAHALVHATLALAEQQRIANLIALAAHEPGNTGAYFRSVLSVPGEHDTLSLRDEIREGLGL